MQTKEESIELSAGTLFFDPPGGGEPVAIGEVKSIEITEESTNYIDELGNPYPYITQPATNQEITIELEPLSLRGWFLLTQDAAIMILWAKDNLPRVLHLAAYAKTARRRRKNIRRIVRTFLREVCGCG